jgi:L-asparaginase
MGVISLIFTGGTISMTVDPETGAASPSLAGDALLAAIADELPPTRTIDWGKLPASHFRMSHVLEIARLVQREADDPEVDGVVVVQGTDSLDETAFAWDLLVQTEVPVIVVGAMRNASQPGFDGPQNLRDAILAAADPRLRGLGVLVAMSGQLLGADDVTKTHTTAYATFQSPNHGPLGHVGADGVHLARRRTPARLGSIPVAADARVALVTAALSLHDDDIPGPDHAAGFVVAAMGAGNTDARILAAAREWMAAGRPVVLASRCASGAVTSGYGFEGGSSTWRAAGALYAGTLTPLKARVLLILALACGLTPGELAAVFHAFGGGR